MNAKEVRLGLCFFDNHLFYAVGHAKHKPELAHIGAIDFSFNILRGLSGKKDNDIKNLREAANGLKERFDATHFQVLLNPTTECWTVLPKLVYDNAQEREAHINILMDGVKRNNIHVSWHPLSNEKYKLLKLQTNQALSGVHKMLNGQANIQIQSAFEIGEYWINHQNPGGSFLTICCYKNCMAISSFILGKLRGTTYISFDHLEDLPYLWLQHCRSYAWMQGLHDQIQVYGAQASAIIDLLKPFFDDQDTITKMNSLDRMQVTADEQTYGFGLEHAYPAIMMALGS